MFEINDEVLVLNDLSIDRAAYKRKVKIIPDSKGFYVDNRGSVFTSRDREVAYESQWDKSKRCRITMKDGSQQWRYVNSLVLQAFGIEKPSKRHSIWARDGDRANAALTNLTYVVPVPHDSSWGLDPGYGDEL